MIDLSQGMTLQLFGKAWELAGEVGGQESQGGVGAKALWQKGGSTLEDGERPGERRGRGPPRQGWRMGWGLVSRGRVWPGGALWTCRLWTSF